MKLPRIVSSLAGPEIEGAGPGLLSELLIAWEQVLAEYIPEATATMLPGVPDSTVYEAFDEFELEPIEELLVWWEWHNGHVPGAVNNNRNQQFSLEDALSQMDRLLAFGQWHLPWVPVARESAARGIAVASDPRLTPPTVRLIDGELGASTEDGSTRHQAVSLCTPVAWWIMGFREGWQVKNPVTGTYILDRERVPTEWWMTGLI